MNLRLLLRIYWGWKKSTYLPLPPLGSLSQGLGDEPCVNDFQPWKVANDLRTLE